MKTIDSKPYGTVLIQRSHLLVVGEGWGWGDVAGGGGSPGLQVCSPISLRQKFIYLYYQTFRNVRRMVTEDYVAVVPRYQRTQESSLMMCILRSGRLQNCHKTKIQIDLNRFGSIFLSSTSSSSTLFVFFFRFFFHSSPSPPPLHLNKGDV